MKLKLSKPICFFDLETTGVNITTDRIVEISILKVHPEGKEESKTWLVNPEMPISKEVTAIHGISDADVADQPTFKELAKEIYNLIKDSDLGGFNSNRFDIPLLAEEMLRAEIDFDMKNRVAIDVQTIFHKMEQRTLSAAYKFYCPNLQNMNNLKMTLNFWQSLAHERSLPILLVSLFIIKKEKNASRLASTKIKR